MVNFFASTLSFKEIFSNPFAISLVYVSYTYSGWNAATYITSEIQNPQKNVPRALLLGTLFVTLLYIGLNFIFLYTIPFSEINPSKLELGVVAAKNSFGHKYGIILGIGLSLALIASISSMIFAGPRVTQVVGEDYSFFRFASIRNKNGAPYVATLVQMTITLLLLLTSTFKDIFTYVAFTLSLITLLTVFGVFIVRFKKLSNLNNYRTWGYPITPIIFILLTSWMLVYALISAPKPSLLGLATAISGLVFYYLSPKNLNLTLQSKKITHKK
jgi:APA family basic amino acid/polyamine antiporter